MFDKIAQDMNELYGSSDMDAGLVEAWLRDGDTRGVLSGEECWQIEDLLDKYL